jgi:hypothetical protein
MDTWLVQNPEMNGYTAIMAYLPSERISLALTVTRRGAAPATGTNYSQQVFQEIAKYLAPRHSAAIPSG